MESYESGMTIVGHVQQRIGDSGWVIQRTDRLIK